MALDEREFERLADAELHRLLAALDEIGEAIDADLQSGVLTIAFEDGAKYVANSHRAARQIWLAAERRAWHFDYADGKWRTTGGDELKETLAQVVGNKLGRGIRCS